MIMRANNDCVRISAKINDLSGGNVRWSSRKLAFPIARHKIEFKSKNKEIGRTYVHCVSAHNVIKYHKCTRRILEQYFFGSDTSRN